MRGYRRRRIAALPLFVLVACLAEKGSAQVATNITADGTLGTVVAPSATIPGRIDISGGTVAGGTIGNNLFHSFGNFDLATGGTAAWASPGVTISNVVNRVTGGSVSNIYGTIDTTALGGANFYFINPAGVVFGSGFSLNVPAAAHFSTASQIQFADGKTFSLTTPSGSTLTAAAPSAFGFVGNEGDIDFTYGSRGQLTAAGRLDLTAANVHLTSIDVSANGVDITAMGTAPLGGPTRLAPIGGSPQPQSPSGEITLRDSSLKTVAGAGLVGNVSLNGGDIELVGSSINSESASSASSGTISVEATGTIDVTGIVGTPTISSSNNGSGSAGDITINGAAVHFRDADVESRAAATQNGNAGKIDVASTENEISLSNSNFRTDGTLGNITLTSASDVTIGGGSSLTSVSNGPGKAGTIRITGDGAVDITGYGVDQNGNIQVKFTVTSSALGATGDAGNVEVTGGAVHLHGASLRSNAEPAAAPRDDSELTQRGRGGSIEITSTKNDIQVLDGSNINSNGRDGTIKINSAGDFTQKDSVITASTFNVLGDAGGISVNAKNILIGNGRVDTVAKKGFGGKVELTASRDLTFLPGAQVNAIVFGDKKGGDINISAGAALRANSALLAASNLSTGEAGSINMKAASISFSAGSRILSSATTAPGAHAGTIKLASTDGDISLAASTVNTDGAGGDITLASARDVTIGASSLTSESKTFDKAGTITVSGAGIVNVAEGSTLSSSNRTGSTAGEIALNSTGSKLLLNGVTLATDGALGNIKLTSASDTTIAGSTLTSESSTSAAAGAISITANGDGVVDVTGTSGAKTISSSNSGTGNAGSVTIKGAAVRLQNAGLESTATTAQNARAGTIDLTSTRDGISLNRSTLNTDGAGGDITLASARDVTIGASSLTSESKTFDKAGTITVSGAGIVNVAEGSTLSSSNRTGSTAGEIALNSTGSKLLLNGVTLATDGALGNIKLTSASDTTIAGSTLTSESSTSAAAGAISITANGDGVVDVTGTSGAKTISSSNSGTGNAGSVTIKGAAVRLQNAGLESTATTAQNARAGTIDLTSTRDGISLNRSTLNTDGAGGDITLASARDVTIGASSLTSESKTFDKAGTITVSGAGIVNVAEGSTLSSSNRTGSTAGEIALNSTGSKLLLNGVTLATDGALGNIKLTSASDTTIAGSTLTSESSTSAAAGAISITANGDGVVDVTGTSGAKTISSSNSGTGNAGSVTIKGAAVRLQNAGLESTATTAQNARAGNIDISSTKSGISLAASSLKTDGKLGDITLASARDVTIGSSSLTSESSSAEPAGAIRITAPQAINITGISGTKTISSSNTGTGNAGSIVIGTVGAPTIDIASATITSEGYNPETKTGVGAAGSVVVQGSKVTIHNNTVLSTNTFSAANVPAGVMTPSSVSSNSGLVKVVSSGALSIDTSKLTSNTYGAANAGNVEVTGTSATLENAALTSDTYAAGNAGDVLVSAGALTISNGSLLSSQALPGSTGRGGIVSISAGPVSLDKSIVSTASANSNPAGSIALNVASLLLKNDATIISSNTNSAGGGNNSAGAIGIVSKGTVTLADGSSVQTNSIGGPAGDITFDMPNTAVLLLASFGTPSSIQTNSTSATGGEITISNPFAVVLNGGNIQALGPGGGAKVHITTTALIPSSDRRNGIDVDGSFILETQADNVGNSLSTRDLNVLDASRVLRGQCPARRAEGDISQLTYRPLGPYESRRAPPPNQQSNGGPSGPIGGCM